MKHRPYGSQRDTNWFIDIDKCDYIKEVLINKGFIVDGIGFVKVDASGIIHPTQWFGGGGGSLSRVIIYSLCLLFFYSLPSLCVIKLILAN